MYKKRLMLNFKAEIVDKPITYDLIKKYDLIINILQAKVFPEEEGQLIVEIQNDKEEHLLEGIKYLEDEGVEVYIIEETIKHDKKNCVDCGSCTAVCKSGALTMDQNTWELKLNQEKCFLCEMCIAVCPVKALSMGVR